MSIQDLGPTEIGKRGLETHLRGVAATDPVAPDATRDPAAPTEGGDRIEVSLAARALASGEDLEAAARNERLAAEMRSVIEAGGLASPERLERAARRLLGG
jgi:hypothetical protein